MTTSSDYATSWARLSPCEKCLFWWTEVHMYGLELLDELGPIPLIRVGSEALLGGDRDEMERLLDFMGLPWRAGWRKHAERVVDRWHHHTGAPVDPRRVLEHGATVRTATELGYDVPWLDMAALEARYQGTPDAGLDPVGRSG